MISLRGPKLKYFAAALAVIALVAGFYIRFLQSPGFVKTTGTIVALREDTIDNSTVYYPTVEYSVNGKTYTGELDTGSGTYKIGKAIRIQYDPNNPAVVHSAGDIGIYFMCAGVSILAIIVVSTIKDRQNRKQARELREASGQAGYAPSVQGEERELYFLTDLGTLKVGHRLEDRNRRVLYEAKMTKLTAVSAYSFDFFDHEHGTTTPHMVGHAEESDWNSFLIDNHYTFELDGVDVFKHLKQNCVSVDTSFGGGSGKLLGLNARILRDGVEIARAESTSQYPHEEDAEQHKVAAAIPVQGFYRVWTREQNLDLLFVTLLAFARSGAADDKGGSRGALFGTLKNMK